MQVPQHCGNPGTTQTLDSKHSDAIFDLYASLEFIVGAGRSYYRGKSHRIRFNRCMLTAASRSFARGVESGVTFRCQKARSKQVRRRLILPSVVKSMSCLGRPRQIRFPDLISKNSSAKAKYVLPRHCVMSSIASVDDQESAATNSTRSAGKSSGNRSQLLP
jgi:hypothetical protein